MKIYECRPNNLPENLLEEDFFQPLIIGDTSDEINIEFDFSGIVNGCRIGWRKNKTWCGKHPRYWREPTDSEKRQLRKWKNKLKLT